MRIDPALLRPAAVSRAVGLALLLVLSRARAQPRIEPIRVAVQLLDCEGGQLQKDALLSSLRLELESDGITYVERPSQASEIEAWLEVEDDCRAPQRNVRLRVRRTNLAARERGVDLSQVPAALRARTLALGLAELLRAGLVTRDSHSVSPSTLPAHAPVSDTTAQDSARADPKVGAAAPPPAAGAPRPVAADPGSVRASPLGASVRSTPEAEATAAAGVNEQSATEPVAAPAPAGTVSERATTRDQGAAGSRSAQLRMRNAGPWQLALLPWMRWHTHDSTALFGGRAALHAYAFEFAGAALFGGRNDTLGDLRFGLGEALLGYDPLHLRLQSLTLRAGARLGLGAAWGFASAGAAAQAAPAVLFTWDIAAQMALSYALDDHWSLALSVEGGYCRGPSFAADDRILATLSGPFAGAGVGVSWSTLGTPRE